MAVEVSDRDGVWVVALRRPPVNALELGLVGELGAALEAARDDPACRALVLTGAAGCFSAGLDLNLVPSYGLDERQALLRQVNRMILELYGLPKPTVAALSGHAIAGGFVIALACDVRLAARGSFFFGLTEVNVGIPFPVGPLAVVKAELPPPALRYLNLTGARVEADDPRLAGVIDGFAEPEGLLDEAVAVARDRAAAPAYARVKQQFRGETLEALRRAVERDDEPLLRDWIVPG